METAQIILPLAKTLFLKLGIRSISMDDIAREAGISKKTIYQAFPSKDALVDAIIDQHLQEECECIVGFQQSAVNAIEELRMITGKVIETAGSMSSVLLFDLKKYYGKIWDKVHRIHRGQIYEVMVRNLNRGISEGLYRPELNADVIARLYVVKAMSLVDLDLFPDQDFPRAMLVQEHVHYHLMGILSEKGLNYLKKNKL